MSLVTMNQKSYLTFTLHGKAHALLSDYVSSCIRDLNDPDYKCHLDYFRQLANIDGEICHFVDLRSNSTIPFLEANKHHSLIKLQSQNRNLAIIVDNIRDTQTFHDVEIQKNESEQYVVNKNNDRYFIFNIDQLFVTHEITTTDFGS
jgi:chemotaxis signal transduction protein